MNKQIQSDSDKPEFDSQDAPLTDSQILALAGEGREFDMITMKPNNVIAFARALLAQAQVKTEPVATIHWPLWGEPIVTWHGPSQERPYDVDVFSAPVSAPQPKTDLGNDDNSLAGSLDVPTECKSLPDGIEAAAIWVDQRRHDFEKEHGSVDPDTGTLEFGRVEQEEYASELGEIAEGIRALKGAA